MPYQNVVSVYEDNDQCEHGAPDDGQCGICKGEIKEIGVLMKPDLAQAAHDDIKTKTRRVIEGFPEKASWAMMASDDSGDVKFFSSLLDGRVGVALTNWIPSKYGKPGDLIYIKEEHYAYGYWWKTGELTKTGKAKWRFEDESSESYPIRFPNNKPGRVLKSRIHGRMGYFKRNSLFMPKWAVRTWARIVDVRVERLQDITDADAIAEGIEYGKCLNHVACFEDLWNSINADRGYGWDKNPWVWVIEFEKTNR